MSDPPRVKLPGWVTRPPDLTPKLDVLRKGAVAGPDIGILLDPANDVAYKMIDGAYGVLGAEVLGQFVPRALGEQRWGIYVREAALAWLCSRVVSELEGYPALQSELPLRLARAVAAHHYVHLAVEVAVTEAHGANAYLDLLAEHAPRHQPDEELLSELMFRAEAIAGLAPDISVGMELAIDTLMRQAPEGADLAADRNLGSVVDTVSKSISVKMSPAAFQIWHAQGALPQYLVLEPHLPQPVAAAIRTALLD